MVKSIKEFDRDLEQKNIRGQWLYDALLEKSQGGPASVGDPHIWQWSDVHSVLMESREVFPDSKTARRNLSFVNPTIERGGTTHTLIAGVQLVLPGEVAWAHRHPIAAMRFVISGEPSTFTVVNGEEMPMCPNDLILTPAWTWHDHHNTGTSDAVWLDVLDLPIVSKLGQLTYEPYGDKTQPIRSENSDFVSDAGSLLRPGWLQRPEKNFPFRYPWDVAAQTLERFGESGGSPYHGVLLEYANPVNGGPTLPTMSCWLQMLHPGMETRSFRQTASQIIYVVEGRGVTIVGDQEIEWGPQDVISIPNWAWYRHINRSKSERSIFFVVSDEPLLSMMGLLREEPEPTLRRMQLPVSPADSQRSAKDGRGAHS